MWLFFFNNRTCHFNGCLIFDFVFFKMQNKMIKKKKNMKLSFDNEINQYRNKLF